MLLAYGNSPDGLHSSFRIPFARLRFRQTQGRGWAKLPDNESNNQEMLVKKLLLGMFAVLVATSCMVARAQDVAGSWQGTLTPPQGNPLRIVLKIAKVDDKLKGTMFSIDQAGGRGIPVGVVTVDAGTVKYNAVGFGSYEGKLSADGKTMTGTWTQGGPLPLVYTRATEATAWTIPEVPQQAKPMAAGADPTFDVVTIKPSKPDQPGKVFTMRGRQIITVNTSLSDLVKFAYDLNDKQIISNTPWLDTDKFDISGTPDVPGIPNLTQFKSLIRKLLAERFRLAFHREKKELSAYVLTVGKTGSKIKKSESDPNGPPGVGFRALGKMAVINATIEDFANVMQGTVLDRPVVDQTGLQGKFDFTLDWTPDESQFGGAGAHLPPPSDKADAPPGLFTALPEQTGLRLEPTKALVSVLVVDHVEKPSEN